MELSSRLACRSRAPLAILAVALLATLTALGAPPPPRNFACVLDSRFQRAAAAYSAHTPPRSVFRDLAFPANPREYRSLKKSAVLLVTVLTHDPSELPIRGIHATLGRTQVPLPFVAARESRLPPGQIAKALGSYRQDALFLVPTAVVLAGGTLEVDFAAHRSGFPIVQFSPSDAPPFIRSDPNPLAPAGAPFSSNTLLAMIEREYPGFSFKPTGPQAYELSIAACGSARPVDKLLGRQ